MQRVNLGWRTGEKREVALAVGWVREQERSGAQNKEAVH